MQFLLPLAVPAALVGGLVAVTWFQQGFVAGMRCGTALIQPVGLVWLGLLAFTTSRLRAYRRGTISGWKPLGALLLFLAWGVVANGSFANWASRSVETPLRLDPHAAIEQRKLETPFDAVVVLGGGSYAVAPGFYELGSDGERVISAAQAYHAGATRSIIVTGSATDGYEPPTKQSRTLLRSLGVPDGIIFSIEGVNTQAEMESLADLIQTPPSALSALWEASESSSDSRTIGLITSAFHMPRAMRLSRRHQLDLEPLPCAFRAKANEKPWLASDLVPGAENLVDVGKMLKETIAKLAGQ